MTLDTADRTNAAAPPPLTVVLCTYNPRRDVLTLVLDALERQTLPKPQWELLVVDNNSSPALDADDLRAGRSFRVRVVRETWQGKVPAYRAGVLAAASVLLLMLDDDNVLDDDYLELAMRIAERNPAIGAFGGVARLKLEAPATAARWQRPLLTFLGIRDYGDRAITSDRDEWGPWEPIGAGMVIRRAAARKFVEIVDAVPDAANLDRSGASGLLSGGDSLLARASYRVGLACSYQPSLRFDHHIKAGRLRTSYLARIMLGHGRSVVMLNDVLGIPNAPLGKRELLKRFWHRCAAHGWAGPVWWFWDLGYKLEVDARFRRSRRGRVEDIAAPNRANGGDSRSAGASALQRV